MSFDIDALPKTWFERGTALNVIRHCFSNGREIIRIGSGFFTIKGWNLIRKYTREKRVHILVGLDEPGDERARKALIAEIMKDLRTGLDRDRRQAVEELVLKIEAEEFRLVDARAIDHHAKIYFVDSQVAIVGSSNTTGKGLVEQIESGGLITDSEEVNSLVAKFDDYFARAKDLTLELLAALKRWLELATPWDVYLKTMLALEDLPDVRSNYPKLPVSYQVDMIAKTLRQIDEHRGSMLVASTGLGKTIVAVHVALRLYEAGEINNIIVVGPKAVRSNWKREMRAAGLPCEYFVRQALDKKTAKQDRSLVDFEDIISGIQQQQQRWLLIIDECHEFRNRYKSGVGNRRKERQAFKWLKQLNREGSLRALLLTGSPYAKNVENLNNQLFLLPHTAPNRALLSEPEYAERNWAIEEPEQFLDLPVTSQLTTPHVAKYYGHSEGRDVYIKFGEEKRYIPRLMLHSLDIPLLLEAEMTSAIADGYFDLNSSHTIFRESIQRQVRIAWTSSPLALKGVLECVSDTPGGENSYTFEKLRFIYSQSQRQQKIAPILSKLKKIGYSQDLKLRVLVKILQDLQQRGQKAIVFCERRATVVYLKQALAELMPALEVAVTIEQVEDNNYEMKESFEIETLIRQFAPQANEYSSDTETNFDVFVATDAQGVGVNMQDASVVINYDIDWTPIGPIQRAGRILRFWHSPRTVDLHTFVPTLTESVGRSKMASSAATDRWSTSLTGRLKRVMQRWSTLLERHDQSRKLIDLPVLTTGKTQQVELPDLASQITIREGELNLDDIADLEISSYFEHTSRLQEHRRYAQEISSDIISAKTYVQAHPLIYVLLKHQMKYHTIIYNPKTKQLREPDEITILNLIECTPDTPTAIVEYDAIEKLAHSCIEAWCDRQKIDPQEVVRECSLYLKPEREAESIDSLF